MDGTIRDRIKELRRVPARELLDHGGNPPDRVRGSGRRLFSSTRSRAEGDNLSDADKVW